MTGKDIIDYIINNNLQDKQVFTSAEGYINKAEQINLQEDVILIKSNCYVDNDYLKKVIEEELTR
jgi:hypothetical protein